MSQHDKDKKHQDDYTKVANILGKANYSRGVGEITNDTWQSLKSGLVGVPQAMVGLSNLMSGGHTGKLVQDNIWDMKKTQENIQAQKSDTAKAQQAQFERAEGFGGKLGAVLDNPMMAVDATVQSLPQMFAGGLAGRGIGKLAGINNAVARGAIGEGAMMAGSAAENMRAENKDGLLTGKETLASIGTGVLGAGLGLAGGKLAQKMGIADADTLLAGGVRELSENTAKGGITNGLKGIGKGALAEGVFEELPQTIAETALDNWANDRALTENMAGNAAMGLASGGLMGGVMGGASSKWTKDKPPTNNQNPPIETVIGEDYTPDAPSGSGGERVGITVDENGNEVVPQRWADQSRMLDDNSTPQSLSGLLENKGTPILDRNIALEDGTILRAGDPNAYNQWLAYEREQAIAKRDENIRQGFNDITPVPTEAVAYGLASNLNNHQGVSTPLLEFSQSVVDRMVENGVDVHALTDSQDKQAQLTDILRNTDPRTFTNPQSFDNWLAQNEYINQYRSVQDQNPSRQIADTTTPQAPTADTTPMGAMSANDFRGYQALNRGLAQDFGERLAQPQKPSEQLGLDPNAGALSRSAVVAVDSGASAVGQALQQSTVGQVQPTPQIEGLSAYQAQREQKEQAQQYQQAVAKEIFANTPKLTGKQNYIQNGNERLPTQLMVVEADSLLPSTDNTINQARDRNRATSRLQVDSIANNLDPAQLADSTIMGHGSPTISGDGTIIAGNGRTMALKKAYTQGKAEEYRQMLLDKAEEYGLDKTHLAQMKNPVLVKNVGNVAPDKLRQLALNSNETGTMTQSAFENAKADVERVASLNLGGLQINESTGDINTPANRAIINDFVAKFPIEQQNAMRTADGMLSKQGLERFENALLLSAYGDNPTTQSILESTDTELRNAIKAMVATAPSVAKTKQGIADGITPNDDIASDISEALSVLAQLRQEGIKPSDYLAQQGLFGDVLSDTGKRLLDFMDKNIRSVVKIRSLLYKYYANLSQDNLQQDDMFGKPVQTKQSRLNDTFKELGHDEFIQSEPTGTTSNPPTEQAQKPSTTHFKNAETVGNTEPADRATDGAETTGSQPTNEPTRESGAVNEQSTQVNSNGESVGRDDGQVVDGQNEPNKHTDKSSKNPSDDLTKSQKRALEAIDKLPDSDPKKAKFTKEVYALDRTDSDTAKKQRSEITKKITTYELVGRKATELGNELQSLGYTVKNSDVRVAEGGVTTILTANKDGNALEVAINRTINQARANDPTKNGFFVKNGDEVYQFGINELNIAGRIDGLGDYRTQGEYFGKNRPQLTYTDGTAWQEQMREQLARLYDDDPALAGFVERANDDNLGSSIKNEMRLALTAYADKQAMRGNALFEHDVGIDGVINHTNRQTRQVRQGKPYLGDDRPTFAPTADKGKAKDWQQKIAGQLARLFDDDPRLAEFTEKANNATTPLKQNALMNDIKDYASRQAEQGNAMFAFEVIERQNERYHGGELKFSKVGGYQKDLIVTHNISTDGILHAHKMGGLPYASIAITKQQNPLDGFGEVTLIGDSRMIDPQGDNKAQVFGSDIYSPRYPAVYYTISEQDSNKLYEKFYEASQAVGDTRLYFDVNQGIEQKGVVTSLTNSVSVMYQFLKEQNIDIPLAYRETETPTYLKLSSVQKAIKDGVNLARANEDSVFLTEFFGELADSSKQKLEQLLRQEQPNKMTKKILENQIQAYEEAIKTQDFRSNVKVNSVINALEKEFIASNRQEKEIDNTATKEAIQKAIEAHKKAFDDYVQNIANKIKVKEKLYDGETRTGEERYVGHTLLNVVKKLKKGLRGGEQTNYGLPTLRAKITPKFDSISDIRYNKHRLLNKADFETVKTEFETAIATLGADIGLQSTYRIEDFLDSVIENGSSKAFKDFGIKTTVTNKKLVADFIAKLENMPTEYFEVKAKDVTAFSDFKGAVIPNDLDPKVRQILEQAGLTLYTYDKSDPNSRKSVIKNATNELDENVGDILFQKNQDTKFGTTADEVLDTLNKRFGKDAIIKLQANNSLAVLSLEQAREQFGNIPDNADGFYVGGTAYLIHDNIHPDMIIPTFLHELGGHGGLQTLMSDTAYQGFMREFDRLVASGDKLAVKAKTLADKHSKNKAEAQNEYLPYLITLASRQKENQGKIKSLINRMMMAIRTFIRQKLGVSLPVMPDEIVLVAEKAVRERASGKFGKTGDTQYSLNESVVADIDQQAKVLQGEPIARVDWQEVNYPIDGDKHDVFDWAKQMLDKQGRTANNPTLGEIEIGNKYIRDTWQHGGGNPPKNLAYVIIKDVLEKGVIVAQDDDGKGEDSFFISAPVTITGRASGTVENIVTATVHRKRGSQKIYVHAINTTKKLMHPRVPSATDNSAGIARSLSALEPQTRSSRHAGQLNSVDIHNILQKALTYKSQDDNLDIQFSRMADFWENNTDKAKETVEKMGKVASDFITNPKSFVKQGASNAKADHLGKFLQFLGRRQLTDLYGKKLQGLKEYNDRVAQMDADSNETAFRADQLVNKWAKVKDSEQLAELMHDVTLTGIDPTAPVKGAKNAKHAQLKARYDRLSDMAKEVFNQAKDDYQTHYENLHRAMVERIQRNDKLSDERKAKLIDELDKELQASKKAFFPLTRFGDYVVVVRDTDGNVVNVARAETKGQADEVRRQLIKDNPNHKVGQVTLGRDVDVRRLGGIKGLASEFLADDLGLDDKLHQDYLNALLDRQFATNNVMIKNTAGFSQNARRAYAHHMSRGSHHIAKLRHTDRLKADLERMQAYIDSQDDDVIELQRVMDELNKRHELLLNPPSHPVSSLATAVGFMWYMGLSPASALVNLSQTLLVAMPMMSAKYGFAKSNKMLGEISALLAKNKNDLSNALTGDEKKAFDEAVRRGVIDMTQAHDLAGVANGENSAVMEKIKPVMKVASVMFHQAEKFNRQVTFVASYRLAVQKGLTSEQAMEEAIKITYDGHFDYASSNRPRFMQGNWQRVLFLFKQYGQNMVYTLARQTYLSFKGETPQAKAEARKILAGILAGHAMSAGVLGLPLVSTLLAFASALGGDDDEPWDAEVALRNQLAKLLGDDVAEVITKGLPRAFGADLSSRVGLDSLILPRLQDGLEGQRLGENLIVGLAGPVMNIPVSMTKGMGQIGQGQTLQGIENMIPKALRDPLKAYRYATQGNVDKSGIEIVEKENVSKSDIAQQVIGFRSGKFAQAQEVKSAIYQADKELTGIRKGLVDSYARAYRDGDTKRADEIWERIKRFNEKNPSVRITKPALMKSIRERNRRIENAKDGIYLNKNREHLREYGAFGVE